MADTKSPQEVVKEIATLIKEELKASKAEVTAPEAAKLLGKAIRDSITEYEEELVKMRKKETDKLQKSLHGLPSTQPSNIEHNHRSVFDILQTPTPSPLLQSEDFIDLKNSNNSKKRFKTVGGKGTVTPEDKKSKKIEAEGSGGKVTKGKDLSKEAMPTSAPMATPAPSGASQKPPVPPTAMPPSLKPTGVPAHNVSATPTAPKPPVAPGMTGVAMKGEIPPNSPLAALKVQSAKTDAAVNRMNAKIRPTTSQPQTAVDRMNASVGRLSAKIGKSEDTVFDILEKSGNLNKGFLDKILAFGKEGVRNPYRTGEAQKQNLVNTDSETLKPPVFQGLIDKHRQLVAEKTGQNKTAAFEAGLAQPSPSPVAAPKPAMPAKPGLAATGAARMQALAQGKLANPVSSPTPQANVQKPMLPGARAKAGAAAMASRNIQKPKTVFDLLGKEEMEPQECPNCKNPMKLCKCGTNCGS